MRHTGFMRLWAAQTVSAFGSRIAREGFAMSAILSIHATPGELGLLAALARGPGLVVGLFAGSIVDRSRRRSVMIASDLARTALILTVPLAAWLHMLSMMQLYAVAALVGAASILFERRQPIRIARMAVLQVHVADVEEAERGPHSALGSGNSDGCSPAGVISIRFVYWPSRSSAISTHCFDSTALAA